MRNTILSIIVAFAAYSLLDLGKALQKLGMKYMSEKRLKGVIQWIIGIASGPLSSLLILYAVSIGSILIVGAFSGTGLVAATVFSVLVLKENIGPKAVAGLALILFAPFFIVGAPQEPVATKLAVEHLFILIALITGLYGALLLVVLQRRSGIGIVVAAIAGAFGGFVLIFQKISTSDLARSSALLSADRYGIGSGTLLAQLLEIFTNPYALTWIVLSVFSTVILQISYRYDSAVRIIPTFGVNYILVPVVGGVVVFGEILHFLQWLGIGMIFSGVLLLLFKTVPRDKEHQRIGRTEQARETRSGANQAD